MKNTLRPPAVPLVAVDPYFSIWSTTDRLFEDHPRHWTLARRGAAGMIRIDGRVFRFLGKTRVAEPWRNSGEPSGMEQISTELTPLTTTCVFESAGVELTLRFTTPLLLIDLDVLSRPFSYVSFSVRATDGRNHEVGLYFDLTGDWCVNAEDQRVEWMRKILPGGAPAMAMGTWTQNVLGHRGDDIRIDWGYQYLIHPGADASRIGRAAELRSMFRSSGTVGEADLASPPRGRQVSDEYPAMAVSYALPGVGRESVSRLLVLGYDDVASIEYFGKPLRAYCFRNGASFEELAARAVSEYPELMKRCDAFDRELLAESRDAAGGKYADLVALGYRQAIAAHKLVADEDGTPLFFSKECFSNGCIATVDVSYPSMPLFLLYAPELVEGMMIPVFRFAGSDAWPVAYAPHDVGTYPRANGQVYGVHASGIEEGKQMPVEECANMLVMTAAVCMTKGSWELAERYRPLLEKWTAYLLEHGLDPENQLCTDDFAGHLAHNANLSVKAIIGVGCAALIAKAAGRETEGAELRSAAEKMAAEWERMAGEGDHYRLTFTDANTWSLKYNLVWDTLLGLSLFPKEIARKEVAWYLAKRNRYGTPLDSRAEFTKTDWLIWAACLAEKREDMIALIEPIWSFVNETPVRTPFTDWYGTTDGLEHSFHHRSVIGGIFLPVLKKRLLPGS